MTKEQAVYVLFRVVGPQRWRRFVEWLEAGESEASCAHDQSDYEEWFLAEGDEDIEARADAVWSALAALSPGHCRCLAGEGFWTGRELDDASEMDDSEELDRLSELEFLRAAQ